MKKVSKAKDVGFKQLSHLQNGYYISELFHFCACREEGIKKFKEWLESKDVDAKKIRIVKTIGEKPYNPNGTFYMHYHFIFRFADKGNVDRPNCVECGSDKVISKGISWYCKACGRWFLKIYRRRETTNLKQWVNEQREKQPFYSGKPIILGERLS